MTIEVVYQWVH